MEMYANEDMYWHQRSNESVYYKGTTILVFFIEWNGKRPKHTMKSLSENDVIIEGTGNLLSYAYKDLFGPVPGNMFNISLNLWEEHAKISVEDSVDLT
jgi:hypothetical protein